MNPEEFDKRLSESFKSEFLPPDKKLWQNIDARLSEGGKKPFWYWLVPVAVFIVAFGGWLLYNTSSETENIALQSNHTAISGDNNSVKKTGQPDNISENKTPAGTIESESPDVETSDDETFISSANTATDPKNNNGVVQDNHSKNPQTAAKTNTASNPANRINTPEKRTDKNVFLTSNFQPLNPSDRNSIRWATDEEFPAKLTMLGFVPPAKPEAGSLDESEMIVYDSPFKNRKTYKSPYSKNPVNFDNPWFWSAGIGPQVAFNKAIIPADSQAWVHKDLWANNEKMSGNSTGLQSNLMLGRKFGQYFSVEAGFQYGLHSEDIRFDLSSYDVEIRDTHRMITHYIDSLLLWFSVQGSNDTTWYYATRGFSMSEKNRYNIYTIPVRFNFEYEISERSRFVAGVGAGLTMMTISNSYHLNLTKDNEKIVSTKSRQYTGSLNAQIAFYTNFNDIGQLGVYSGFQWYISPWELPNKQYAIRMSDLQLGISFRRPLNW